MIKLLLAVLIQSVAVRSLDQLVIKGNKFFNARTGEQFYFKGVDYQPRLGNTAANPDPLADVAGCKRDIEAFKDLGLNSIRVYEVDYNNNHDECMKALDDAGIYLVLDVPSPKYSVNRASPTWDTYLFENYKKKVDAFMKYPNLAAFLIGNEVTNDKTTTPASAYVKAALRDIKTYLNSTGNQIPVGYADNDDEEIRLSLIDYFNCGDDPMARADFYGVNTYRWCGNVNFKTSGYANMIQPFVDYGIPVMITEYGCNKVQPRTFSEVKAIYSPELSEILSGGFVYEYSQEDNNYGLVTVTQGSSSVKKTPDYPYLKSAYGMPMPAGVNMKNYNPSISQRACPEVGNAWRVGTVLPPTPKFKTCECMMDSLNCIIDPPADFYNMGDTTKEYGLTADNICGLTSCDKVGGDTVNGTYGDFSYCSPVQRISWIINKNLVNNGMDKKSCSIAGIQTKYIESPKQSSIKNCGSVVEEKLTPSTNEKSRGDATFGKKSSGNVLLPFDIYVCTLTIVLVSFLKL